MGAKDSKPSFISYDDAVKRVSESELGRIREAFKRCAGGNGTTLSADAFIHDVLCDGVPTEVADWLYNACGGTRRGIAFRELLCGLVVLTKGTTEEKIKFLWTLYVNTQNDSTAYIYKWDFVKALQLECWSTSSSNPRTVDILTSLFGPHGDRVGYDQFRSWLLIHKSATVLSRWLLAEPCVHLTSDLETPSFYQILAGVTHLEERDIIELEKCFWTLHSAAPSRQLDADYLLPLLSPPLPRAVLAGVFLAFDENRDGHVDFKELCCGLSAACRGPRIERLKFCFKIFDVDRDGILNQLELRHMVDILTHVANESLRNQNMSRSSTPDANNLDEDQEKMFEAEHVLDNLYDNLSKTRRFSKEPLKPLMRLGSTRINEDDRMDYVNNAFVVNDNASDSVSNGTNEEEHGADSDSDFSLSQEDFLIWSVESAEALVTPFLDLIFEVCHIVLGLRPQCKHQERDIVLGWLWREVQRGYAVGQFWYLISSEWWSAWSSYTQPGGTDACCGTYRGGGAASVAGRGTVPVDEAIVCDESFTSNSTESMGSLLFRADTVSVGSAASSSGVSSGVSGARSPTQRHPGYINNARLLATNPYKVRTLTGEGGHLARDRALVQHQDFELVPDALWRALAQWYGGPQPLPRQVVRPPNSDVELELYPLTLRLLRHVPSSQHANTTSWSGMVGGYGAAALSSVGAAAATPPRPSFPPERQLAYTAAFSRLATVKQVSDFLCVALGLAREDVRLWQMSETGSGGALLEDETPTLAQLGFVDGQRLLVEVRNRDLTWPEEIGALSVTSSSPVRRGTLGAPSFPGATGLHNLGNTCFMNAALQAVWNTGPLTRYFNSGMHLYEVNSENPLGTRGALAQRYGELCKEVWSSQMRSVAPLHVRVCVQRHAPHLAGGGQHDAQEMLAWLLDCLHEDLNRVRGPRPAERELQDSDGRPDQVVAAEAWAQHTNRNASVITDLFYGQLKSRVRCITCGKESVRFDAFNMLSLPLPMESYTHCEIKVMLLDGSVPIKYGIRVNSEGHYRDLKSQLSQLCGLSPAAMLLVQAGGPWMGRVLEDGARVRPAKAAELVVYELPGDVERSGGEDCVEGRVCNGCGEDGVCEQGKEGWSSEEKRTPGRPSTWQEVSRTPQTPPSSLCMPALFCFQRSKSDSKMCQSPPSTFYTNKLGREITIRTNPAAIEQHDFSDQERGHTDEIGSVSSYTMQPVKENDVRQSPTLSVKSLNINHDSPHLKRMKFGSSPSNMNRMGETPSVGSETLHKYNFLVAVHRKQSRQDTYFLSQHKSRPELFGVPLLVPLKEGMTSREIYICVWNQVSRFLSAQPPTPPDQSNHATDCDDSLCYTFPFTLRAVRGGAASVCAVCPWPRFCRGCLLPCADVTFVRNLCPRTPAFSGIKINSKRDPGKNTCSPANSPLAKAKLNRGISARDSEDGENQTVLACAEREIESLDFNELRHLLTSSSREESNGLPDLMLAIDWDPTALHLRYQSTREEACLEDPSVEAIRLERARPVGLPHCLKAFTADERLEQPYHCAGCRSSQPATKKLQIWRLPPVLIIHLKRFQYVNNKWIKSQKVVNFPFHDFDPTAYLASVPQETILRHHDLRSLRRRKSSGFNFDVRISESDDGDDDLDVEGGEGKDCDERVGGRLSGDGGESRRSCATTKCQFHPVTPSEPRRTTESKPPIQKAPEDGRERRHKQTRRERLESTSLVTTPVLDDDLVDYHQHKLREGQDPFDLKYKLYAVVSHSGQMSGGHYVAYARNPSGAWYCYNDSSCRELATAPNDQESHPVPPIDPSSAYLLFYQRHGLDNEPYLPEITGRQPVITEGQFAESDGDELKKMCVLC